MPIFRMPVVLHANYPHANNNCPYASSPNANCPSTDFIKERFITTYMVGILN